MYDPRRHGTVIHDNKGNPGWQSTAKTKTQHRWGQQSSNVDTRRRRQGKTATRS